MENKIDNVLAQAIKDFNESSEEFKIVNSSEYLLMGQNSELDSLALVKFVIGIEQELEKAFSRYIAVIDETGLDDDDSNPFATVGSLKKHLSKLVENE